MISSFTIKETKTGNIAIIVPKTPQTVAFLHGLLTETFALPSGNTTDIESEEFAKFKAEVAARESAGKQATTVTPPPLNTVKLGVIARDSKRSVSYSYDYDGLTDQQRTIADLALDIHEEILRYAALTGKSTNESKIGYLYTPFYTMLRRECKYYPSKRSAIPYIGRYVPTRLNTVLLDGKGRELLSLIRREVRLIESRMVRI